MMTMLEMHQLRAFRAVAQEGSFTRAAGALFLTQPAVSQAISALEEKLDHDLFDRRPRETVLTQAGQELLRLVEPLLSDWEALPDRLEEALDGEPAGPLTVGAGEALLLHWLPDLLKRFNDHHPRVRVLLRHERTEDSLAGLLSGRLDLALRSVGEVPPKLEAQPLFETERVLIAPKGAKLPRRVQPADLVGRRFVVPRAGAVSRRILEGLLESTGRTLDVTLESGGWAVLKRQVAAGLGLALVPELTLRPDERKELVVRRAPELFGRESFALLRSKTRPVSRAGRAFAELCLASAAPG